MDILLPKEFKKKNYFPKGCKLQNLFEPINDVTKNTTNFYLCLKTFNVIQHVRKCIPSGL